MNELSELTAATRQVIEKANKLYGKNFPIPVVSLELSGVCAGYAYYKDWMVKYNPQLYINNKETFLNRTVPHEVAHLVARSLYGMIKSHGREWKMVMRDLGVTDVARCHSYDISVVKHKRKVARPYTYECRCKQWHLTLLIHRKICMGQTRSCPVCRMRVIYKGKAENVEMS